MADQPSASAPTSTSTDMKSVRLVMKKLGETFDNFHLNASSMLSLSEQLKNLQSSFTMAEASMASRAKELELKEKENVEISKKVANLLREVELRKIELDLKEKSVKEKMKEVELKENSVREIDERVKVYETMSSKRCEERECRGKKIREEVKALELRRKELDEICKKLEVKEREVNEGFQTCYREIELKKVKLIEIRRALGVKERELKERCEEMELKRAQMDEERKGLELKEKEVNVCLEVLEVKKKELSEDFKVLEVKKEELSEDFKVLEVKKKELSEGFKVLELKERLLGESRKGLQLVEKVVDERFRQLELKEMEMDEGLRELESKKKEFDERLQAVELKEKEVSEDIRALKLKEKEVGKRLQAVDLKENEARVRIREVELKEKTIGERCREVKLKETEVTEALRGMALVETEVDERCRAVELKEKEMSKRFRVVELNEKRINEQCNSLKLKEKALIERQQVLELGEKRMNESLEALELKVKQVAEFCKGIELKHRQAVELREKQLDEGFEALEMKVNQLAEFSNEMELKEKEINELWQAMEVKEKQLTRRGRVLDLREQQICERCEALESKEKEISQQCETLEFRAKQVDEHRQSLELKEREMSEFLSAQDLKATQINDVCNVLMKEQICKTCKAMDSAEKETDHSLEVVDFKVKQSSSEPQPETSQVASAVASSLPSDIQLLCRNMDAEGVSSYLIEHVKESDIWDDKTLDSLRLASDPAKLVLDVTRSFYHLGVDNIPGDDCKAGCIYLLVQLMKLQPDITHHVENEAKEFATSWRGSLAKQGSTAPEIFCFLQFLASYNLAGSYDADELLSLFETFYNGSEVYWPDQNPKLCHALGLTEKIPDLIQSLIMEDKQLQAVMYICAFQMEDAFPPESLLEAYLQYIQKTAEDVLKQDTTAAQDEAANMELSSVRAVLKCISSFKLESKYSPVPLEMRIKQLEKEMEERKSTANLKTVKKCDQNLEEDQVHDCAVAETSTLDLLSDAQSLPHDQKKRIATSVETPEQEKRPRLRAHQRMTPDAPSSPYGQAAHDWPYQYHAPPHRALWHGHHYGASSAVYGIPFDIQTGRYGVPGVYPVGSHTHIYQARGQSQRTAHPRDSVTANANAFRRSSARSCR